MSENKSCTRSQQAEKTRRMLFEKGREILRDVNDCDDFSVEDITSACGVSKGTFYVHFKSKGAFFYNVKHALARDANAELIELLQSTDSSARWVLTEFVREWVRRSRQFNLPFNEDLLAFMTHSHSPEESMGHLDQKHLATLIRAQVLSGIGRAEFRPDTPVDIIVGLVVVTLTGSGMLQHAQPEGTDCDIWADEAAKMLDEGVLRRWLSQDDPSTEQGADTREPLSSRRGLSRRRPRVEKKQRSKDDSRRRRR